MKYPIIPNSQDDNFVDDFGAIIRNDPEENYIDIRVEMSSFRDMILTFAHILTKRKVISQDEYKLFSALYNFTAKGDVLGKSVTARVYKMRYAIANSAPREKDGK